jgi:hypothetical protein
MRGMAKSMIYSGNSELFDPERAILDSAYRVSTQLRLSNPQLQGKHAANFFHRMAQGRN